MFPDPSTENLEHAFNARAYISACVYGLGTRLGGVKPCPGAGV